MPLVPRLTVKCTRCGQPREGLRHVCRTNSATRKAKLKVNWSFGKCTRCHKPLGNPLTHRCRTQTDFKARKAAWEKQQKAAGQKDRPKHDYQACSDNECPRPLCVAYRTGYKAGNLDGYKQGWQQGYERGFPDGQRACPLPHGGN